MTVKLNKPEHATPSKENDFLPVKTFIQILSNRKSPYHCTFSLAPFFEKMNSILNQKNELLSATILEMMKDM